MKCQLMRMMPHRLGCGRLNGPLRPLKFQLMRMMLDICMRFSPAESQLMLMMFAISVDCGGLQSGPIKLQQEPIDAHDAGRLVFQAGRANQIPDAGHLDGDGPAKLMLMVLAG